LTTQSVASWVTIAGKIVGGSLVLEFASRHLVDIAPYPRFAGFDGTNQWVVCPVEMLGGMFILGRVAAPYVPATKAKPQMDPGIPHLHAFLADVHIGFADFDLVEMGAFTCHRVFSIGIRFSVK
jgi:hypothetical protein